MSGKSEFGVGLESIAPSMPCHNKSCAARKLVSDLDCLESSGIPPFPLPFPTTYLVALGLERGKRVPEMTAPVFGAEKVCIGFTAKYPTNGEAVSIRLILPLLSSLVSDATIAVDQHLNRWRHL